jgi:hypothetical protein
MMTSRRFIPDPALLAICAAAVLLRLALLLVFVRFPGVADPNHYYNVGARLARGDGYTIDYIWRYSVPYEAVVHPEDYWMPLTALAAGAGMAVLGVGVFGAVVPFTLLGGLLPALAYAAARGLLHTGRGAALFAAGLAALLPQLVLNSVRTDTTLIAVLTTSGALLLWAHALQPTTRRPAPWFVGAGVLTGLAYLNRSEALLIPIAFAACWALLRLLRQRAPYSAALALAAALIVVAPWLARNVALNGTFSTPTTGSLFFMTEFNDLYVVDYSRLTLANLLETQPIGALIGLRAFQAAAGVRQMLDVLDVLLPVALAGGLLLIAAERDRDRLRALAAPLLLLLGYYLFYALIAPFYMMGGSFKKAFISLLPLLIPVAAYAIERAIGDPRLRAGAMLLSLAIIGANAVDTVRLDAAAASAYADQIARMADVARALPDRTGDGQITLMTQDPFILSYAGFPNVVFPNEPRDVVAAVAARYGVDYLLMPANRPSLDALLTDPALDPRFTRTADVPGTPFIFMAVDADAR